MWCVDVVFVVDLVALEVVIVVICGCCDDCVNGDLLGPRKTMVGCVWLGAAEWRGICDVIVVVINDVFVVVMVATCCCCVEVVHGKFLEEISDDYVGRLHLGCCCCLGCVIVVSIVVVDVVDVVVVWGDDFGYDFL